MSRTPKAASGRPPKAPVPAPAQVPARAPATRAPAPAAAPAKPAQVAPKPSTPAPSQPVGRASSVASAPVTPPPAPSVPGNQVAPAGGHPRAMDPRAAGNPFLHSTLEVARKEVLQHARTKRLLILGPIFLVVLVLVTIVFPMLLLRSTPAEARDGLATAARQAGTSVQNVVILFFLSPLLFLSGYFYVELIPILLTADAVCSEWSSRTLFLLLSRPVSRASFVLGKFLGSIATVAAFMGGLLILDYCVLQAVLPGASTGTDWLRFLGTLGILLLGAMAYASVALFFSTLTRSAITANLSAIAVWMMGFPLLAKIDYFIAIGRYGIQKVATDPKAAGVGWSQYLSPGEAMTVASKVLAPKIADSTAGVLSLFAQATPAILPALGALVLHIGVFLGLSFVVVQRRNFE